LPVRKHSVECVMGHSHHGKETQRVAFRMGDNDTLVAETGLYNLTQDEVPLLVHFGTEQTQTYLLVRLEEPAEGDDQ